uniref:Uncharacterized protein n=1 Tax=Chenopodium quinoa TaxID=63459 RepID=A0A803MSC9_CHEQI
PQVQSDHDTESEFEVETHTAPDGTLRARRTRHTEIREREYLQTGSEPAGAPLARQQPTDGSAPITRNELMTFMRDFKGEIQELINKK